jgi:hypothetical protein
MVADKQKTQKPATLLSLPFVPPTPVVVDGVVFITSRVVHSTLSLLPIRNAPFLIPFVVSSFFSPPSSLVSHVPLSLRPRFGKWKKGRQLVAGTF